ncbi:hypothetical protein [Dokdonella sp.]|uniref:hypothetical protein n=1 Tax=Dokdonella sp. TaxID=2291710 RepID=UPI0031C6C83F|nr:hypothetical protein [Dokdonella sp.]
MQARLPEIGHVKILAFIIACVVACLLSGAIPWLGLPTLGQALWASGFAQSYANNGWFAIYATDFGLPMPAPIAFGLSGTLVQGWLIRALGIAAIDAYTLMVSLYLALAVWGACALARLLGASYYLSLLLGLLWLALPIVWGHADYSMVALGFALLPLYLYSSFRMLMGENWPRAAWNATTFIAVCILAVFMDGYTFMMFVAAATIAWSGALISEPVLRRRNLIFVLPCMATGFGLAYVLYTTFLGSDHFDTSPLDFFRGWGVDAVMLLWPSSGAHWIWDAIGVGTTRRESMFWGDASVWMTTFIAPLLISGVAGFVVACKHPRAGALLAMAVLGLYLALGPSLKIHSTKQVAGISSADRGQLMPEKYALMPTGSAWLSENLPGFRNMRAAYRWTGLGALGLWGLTTLLLARGQERRTLLPHGITICLIVLFLPHLAKTVHTSLARHRQAEAIDAALGQDLRKAAGNHGTLFFAPHGNDFIVNYLAVTAGFRSYNIGGNKNVEKAQLAWSDPMLALNSANLATAQFQQNLHAVLLFGLADAVVLPYFDMLHAAHRWPPSAISISRLRAQRLPVAEAAAASPCFALQRYGLFAAVSLSEDGKHQRNLMETSDYPAQAATKACALVD